MLPAAGKAPLFLRLRRLKGKPFRAVFLNYLLDCLPAAVLEIEGERAYQLFVRTCVARNVNLSNYTEGDVVVAVRDGLEWLTLTLAIAKGYEKTALPLQAYAAYGMGRAHRDPWRDPFYPHPTLFILMPSAAVQTQHPSARMEVAESKPAGPGFFLIP